MRHVTLLALLLLAACSGGSDRAAYLNTLIGQPEMEVVRQLGVPSRTYETQNHKFLAYTQQQSEVISGGPFLFGGFGGGYGGGFGYGSGFGPGFGYAGAFPSEIIPRTCETTFDTVGGRVVTWSLRGNACD